MQKELDQLLEWNWYTQGVPCYPLYILSVAGMPSMHKGLGFSYRAIIGLYKDGYGEWNYSLADLESRGELVLQKLKKDPQYLEKTRKKYNQEHAQAEPVFEQAEANLDEATKKELVELLQKLWNANSLTVASSHLLESVSLRFEKDIRHLLKHKKSSNLNQEFSTLTTPTNASFVSEKEEALWKIKNAPATEKKKRVEQFIREFYWYHSSYAGNTPWTEKMVLEEAEQLSENRQTNFEQVKEQKKALFEKYRFSDHEKNLIAWTDYATAWQDDRKKKILRAIYCLAKVLKKTSEKFGIPEETLALFTGEELSFSALEEKTGLEKEAEKRKNGCASIDNEQGRFCFAVKDFAAARTKLHKAHHEPDTLGGTAASLGTATGPVKVCTTLESISKVQEGDILVASMTRPEYVSAMKKAAAVITDEGGITCHAAIVSRELGIPCIIGTKNATRVLKDGWIVQVKANHGQVIILEKK